MIEAISLLQRSLLLAGIDAAVLLWMGDVSRGGAEPTRYARFDFLLTCSTIALPPSVHAKTMIIRTRRCDLPNNHR